MIADHVLNDMKCDCGKVIAGRTLRAQAASWVAPAFRFDFNIQTPTKDFWVGVVEQQGGNKEAAGAEKSLLVAKL